jgi:competence protein ComEC
VTRTLPSDAPTRAFLAEVQQQGAQVRRTAAGDVYLAGAARIEVLLPAPTYRAGPEPSNDDSMVVRISEGKASMLLEGDAQSPGEHWMVDQGEDLASTVLKVGHHGSKTSSTPAFLAAVHPAVAVISDGVANQYGFPAPSVLDNLAAAGARVFRTDRDGAIQCRLVNGQLQVYLFRRWGG